MSHSVPSVVQARCGDRYEFHNTIGASKRPRPANLVICEPVPGHKPKHL